MILTEDRWDLLQSILEPWCPETPQETWEALRSDLEDLADITIWWESLRSAREDLGDTTLWQVRYSSSEGDDPSASLVRTHMKKLEEVSRNGTRSDQLKMKSLTKFASLLFPAEEKKKQAGRPTNEYEDFFALQFLETIRFHLKKDPPKTQMEDGQSNLCGEALKNFQEILNQDLPRDRKIIFSVNHQLRNYARMPSLGVLLESLPPSPAPVSSPSPEEFPGL